MRFFGATLLFFGLSLLPLLIAVAYVILAERKVMASIQRRKGPDVVGWRGLLQPFIDAVKLLSKEHIFPRKSNLYTFVFGPLLMLTVALVNWSFLPFTYTNFYYNFNCGVLYIFVFSSISGIGMIIAGWSSNSKYALLGALRAISQFVSYEIVLLTSILPIIIVTGSLNFIDIVHYQELSTWFIIPFWPLAYIFFIASLAETNRTPFDLAEAEAELVAGYNTEYSSVFFILFMFAEYSNILLMSALFSLFFLGGWTLPLIGNIDLVAEFVFALKLSAVAFIFILVRATQPRLRFDQLLSFCWKDLIPVSFCLVLLYVATFLSLYTAAGSETFYLWLGSSAYLAYEGAEWFILMTLLCGSASVSLSFHFIFCLFGILIYVVTPSVLCTLLLLGCLAHEISEGLFLFVFILWLLVKPPNPLIFYAWQGVVLLGVCFIITEILDFVFCLLYICN